MASDVFGILGTVVAGAYQVDEVVAEGGFGVVYRAYHAGFRAPVALKCLKIPQAVAGSHADEFLEQFRAEAELLFRLSASIPTVVRPLHVDAMTAPDGSFVPFMALEWLEGETLEAVFMRRKAEGRPAFSVKKLTRLLTPVARALERAHNFTGPDGPISIVHRDLKPENIFLAQVAGEEVVKILDFGIGKAKSVASQVAGRASQSEGALASFTPAYGAPEQWLPKRFGQTGPWTDVWGLALTLVEVMAARPIIDGDQAAMMGTALDESRRPTPRNEGIDVTDEVERVFLRALALDPRDRYDDAGLFWNDLTAAVGLKVADSFSGARRRRDLRAEGDAAVPRVEQIEAAMPTRQSSGPPKGAPDRTAATMAAPEVPESQSASLSPFSRPAPVSRSGEHPAAAPTPPASAPSAELDLEIPDLVPGGASSAAPPAASPPAAALPAAAAPAGPKASQSGENVIEPPPGSGSFDLALDLDLPPGERPVARGGSGQYTAARPGSGPRPAVQDTPEPPSRSPGSSARWNAVDAHAGPSSAPPIRSASPPPSRPLVSEAPAPRNSATPGSHLPSIRAPGTSADVDDSPVKRFALPGGLIAAGIVITVADQLYAGSSGEVFMLGPLRASFIATPLVLGGIGLLIWKLLPRGDTE